MSEILIPIIALIVAGSIMVQMFGEEHATSSMAYVGVLAAILTFLSVIAFARSIRARSWRHEAGSVSDFTRRGTRNALIIVVATALMIVLMQPLGYALALLVYVLTLGRLLYAGPVWITVTTAICMIGFVHFAIVEELGLRMPSGTIWTMLQAPNV